LPDRPRAKITHLVKLEKALLMVELRFWPLFRQLLRREILGRYRGSFLGIFWSFALPLAMLAIYTFIFGGIFKARWNPSAPESPVEFALALFAGLIVFNFFAEVVTRAPTLVVSNPSYVKKVVFPLALLPLAAVGAALFHALMSLAVLLLGLAALGKLSFWALALPLVWAPLLLFTAGVAWFLAALGVFLRDISQATGPLVTAVLFLSPVFYPASALPENLRPWLFLNPLTVPIEAMRALTFGNQPPNWAALGIHALSCALIGFFGWLWFTKTQKGFADVL